MPSPADTTNLMAAQAVELTLTIAGRDTRKPGAIYRIDRALGHAGTACRRAPPIMVCRDLRLPDVGDQVPIAPPRMPEPAR